MVGQLRVADRAAQQFQVTRGVGGGNVLQDRPGLRRTPVGEVLRRSVEGVVAARVARHFRERTEVRLLLGERVETPDGGAVADAPRVPRHEVEPGTQLVREQPRPLRALPQPLQAGRAGPAEVDEQRADPVRGIGGGQLDERQIDLVAERPVVVQRHRSGGTPEAVLTVHPAQLRCRGAVDRSRRLRRGGRDDRRDTQCDDRATQHGATPRKTKHRKPLRHSMMWSERSLHSEDASPPMGLP